MENNLGIRHLALKVKNFEGCFIFYTEILGMKVDWKPDDNNVYLTNGSDNLALHRDDSISTNQIDSRLDHFGIFVKDKNDIDMYLKHMIPHHQVAVDMSKKLLNNTKNDFMIY